jgi:pilus assembly protein CpaE
VNNETHILLPTARVDLFLKDKETTDAARSLENDWRFARVKVSVEEGDVATAIQSYKETKSPNLIIIETDTTDDAFVESLGKLSEHCDENTSAIIIGPVNDVNLYRSLTSMGVSDYLVRPVPIETLSEIIAGNLIEKLGAKGSRLIAVVGAKGGVGTSSLTQGLSWGISENLKQKTFLMDAAGGWSSLSVGMGFEPATTLYEAVRAASDKDEDNLKRMFFNANENLTVLSAGADPMLEASVHAQQYEELIDLMMVKYPVVVVDLSGAIPSLKRTVINRAHELIVVTTPTLPALRSARSLMQEVKLLKNGDLSSLDLIVNMAGMIPSKEVPKKDIADALDFKPSITIPFDAKLFIGAENEGKKLTGHKAGTDIVNKLLPIARDVLDTKTSKENSDGDQKSGGLLGKIFKKD